MVIKVAKHAFVENKFWLYNELVIWQLSSPGSLGGARGHLKNWHRLASQQLHLEHRSREEIAIERATPVGPFGSAKILHTGNHRDSGFDISSF